jgi:hypothetical protein
MMQAEEGCAWRQAIKSWQWWLIQLQLLGAAARLPQQI